MNEAVLSEEKSVLMVQSCMCEVRLTFRAGFKEMMEDTRSGRTVLFKKGPRPFRCEIRYCEKHREKP